MNRVPHKWQRVLSALLTGQSYSRFEAEKPVEQGGLSDHCLHSTVATIQQKGVRVERKLESIPGYMGLPTEVCRYWLDLNDPANLAKAKALLSPTPKATSARTSDDRWQRAVRAAEQERRDRAARNAA